MPSKELEDGGPLKKGTIPEEKVGKKKTETFGKKKGENETWSCNDKGLIQLKGSTLHELPICLPSC